MESGGPQSDDHKAPAQLTDGYVMRNVEGAVMRYLNDGEMVIQSFNEQEQTLSTPPESYYTC